MGLLTIMLRIWGFLSAAILAVALAGGSVSKKPLVTRPVFPVKAGMEFVSYEIDPTGTLTPQRIRQVRIVRGCCRLCDPALARTDRFALDFIQLEPDFAKTLEERREARRLAETPAGKRGA